MYIDFSMFYLTAKFFMISKKFKTNTFGASKVIACICIAIVLAMGVFLAGCSKVRGQNLDSGDTTPQINISKLSQPTGLKIVGNSLSGNMLNWDSVQNAIRYKVFDKGILVSGEIDDNTFAIDVLGFGEHWLAVQAVGNGVDYSYSELSSVFVWSNWSQDAITLNTPQNVSIVGTTLTFDTVANATGYQLRTGNEMPFETVYTTETIDLSSLHDGQYNLSVRAISSNTQVYRSSEWSMSVEYTATDSDIQVDDILQSLQGTWVVTSTQSYVVEKGQTKPIKYPDGPVSKAVFEYTFFVDNQGYNKLDYKIDGGSLFGERYFSLEQNIIWHSPDKTNTHRQNLQIQKMTSTSIQVSSIPNQISTDLPYQYAVSQLQKR